MKKRLIALLAVIFMLTIAATPALAHGGHRRVSRSSGYIVCPDESCTLSALHSHSGKYYTAHYYGDGHDYHGYCDVENCTLYGYHSHDGTYCFGHTINDGHGHHSSGRGHH